MPRYLVKVADKDYDIEIEYRSEKYFAKVNGQDMEIDFHRLVDNEAVLLVNGQSLDVDINTNGYDTNQTVFMLGQEIPVEIENYTLAQMRKTAGMTSGAAMEMTLKAPMPGLLLDVKVKPGDEVKKGQPLLIIEAMKMENIIKAPGDATIKDIHVKVGSSVEKDDKLLEFE